MTGTQRLLIVPVAFAAALAACKQTPAESQTDRAGSADTNQTSVVPSKDALGPVNAPQTITPTNAAAPVSSAQQRGGEPSPAGFIARYAALLQARNFGEAYKLLDPSMNMTEKQFEERLAGYKTVHVDVGQIGPVEGAAGSLYDTVQLTLRGEKNDGAPYRPSGPVTLRRVNDVPGSTAEQRQWRIYKMDLSSKPKTQPKGEEK
jgi:hypothetical protein